MNWYDVIAFELAAERPFSSLLFWAVLAAIWTVAGSRVLGVPASIVRQAARSDSQAQQDLEDLVRIQARRLHGIARDFGIWIVGTSCALLTGLGLVGFHYRVEFAQALFLLIVPLLLSGAFDLMAATRIDLEVPSGEALRSYVCRQRNRIQFIGVAALLLSVMWGLPKISPEPAFGG